MSAFSFCQSMYDAPYRIVARTVVLLFLVNTLVSVAPGVAAAAEADFYVAPAGDDGWSGQAAESQRRSDRWPFCHARTCPGRDTPIPRNQRTRAAPSWCSSAEERTCASGRSCCVPRISGSQASPVIYESYPGEKSDSQWRQGDLRMAKGRWPAVEGRIAGGQVRPMVFPPVVCGRAATRSGSAAWQRWHVRHRRRARG